MATRGAGRRERGGNGDRPEGRRSPQEPRRPDCESCPSGGVPLFNMYRWSESDGITLASFFERLGASPPPVHRFVMYSAIHKIYVCVVPAGKTIPPEQRSIIIPYTDGGGAVSSPANMPLADVLPTLLTSIMSGEWMCQGHGLFGELPNCVFESSDDLYAYLREIRRTLRIPEMKHFSLLGTTDVNKKVETRPSPGAAVTTTAACRLAMARLICVLARASSDPKDVCWCEVTVNNPAAFAKLIEDRFLGGSLDVVLHDVLSGKVQMFLVQSTDNVMMSLKNYIKPDYVLVKGATKCTRSDLKCDLINEEKEEPPAPSDSSSDEDE